MGFFSDITGGVGDVLGGIIGQGDRNDAANDYRKEREGYEGLNGNINYSNIASDPESRAAQMDALSQMQNQYRSGGLDALDRGRLNDININANQVAEQNRQGVGQEAMRRGNWNGGNELVSKQLAGQNAANMANYQGIQAGSLALQNKQRAAAGAGQLAGDVGNARDMISRFNAANQVQAQQMSFNNALSRQNGISRGYENQAGQSNDQAGYTQRQWGGAGRAIGGGIDAATMPGWDPTKQPGAQSDMTGGGGYT